MLRSVIGNMDLEQTLTSRDQINMRLRGVLDDASGKWGLRVTRVEIKAIDPPKSVVDAMEKQMRAEREKRAAVLTAEGLKQSKILTAEGEKQSSILRAEGEKRSAILKAEGQAEAIGAVFQAVHRNDPDPKLLAYQYLQMLPQLAQGQASTMWVIPSEMTSALKSITSAFGHDGGDQAAAPPPVAAPSVAAPPVAPSPAASPSPAAVPPPRAEALDNGTPIPALNADPATLEGSAALDDSQVVSLNGRADALAAAGLAPEYQPEHGRDDQYRDNGGDDLGGDPPSR